LSQVAVAVVNILLAVAAQVVLEHLHRNLFQLLKL
jgi:hypothetical protein